MWGDINHTHQNKINESLNTSLGPLSFMFVLNRSFKVLKF